VKRASDIATNVMRDIVTKNGSTAKVLAAVAGKGAFAHGNDKDGFSVSTSTGHALPYANGLTRDQATRMVRGMNSDRTAARFAAAAAGNAPRNQGKAVVRYAMRVRGLSQREHELNLSGRRQKAPLRGR